MPDGTLQALLNEINQYRRLLFLPPLESSPNDTIDTLARERAQLLTRLNTNPPPWLSVSPEGQARFQELGATPSDLSPLPGAQEQPFWWRRGVGGTQAQPPATQPMGQPTGQPRQVIEQEGGYDVLVMYDDAGKRTIVNIIGRSQQAEDQQGMQTPEFQLRAMARQATEQRARSEEGLDRRVREGIINALQGELTKLTGPFNWVKRWLLQKLRNSRFKRRCNSL